MYHRLFTDHPRAIGESYGEHFVAASGFGLTMVGAGLACLFHAIVPGLFITTGSTAVERLHDRMVVKRRRTVPPPAEIISPARAEG